MTDAYNITADAQQAHDRMLAEARAEAGMRSSDWQRIETAPLNPYGKPWGPVVLVWCTADNTPVAAYYDPQGGHRDNGPRWVVASDDAGEILIEDVSHWMPIKAPEAGHE